MRRTRLAALDTGRYPDARNRGKAADSPGIVVISNGLSCGSNDEPALHRRIYFQA